MFHAGIVRYHDEELNYVPRLPPRAPPPLYTQNRGPWAILSDARGSGIPVYRHGDTASAGVDGEEAEDETLYETGRK
jgi:hypothetical protein